MTADPEWTFVALCEMAKCSPDFAVIHQLRSTAEQADWLRARITRYGGNPPHWTEIASAIHADRTRPPVAEHMVKIHDA